MKGLFTLILMLLFGAAIYSQVNTVTYAGSTGKETFYDVLQITGGSVLVCGYAEDMSWIPGGVPVSQLTYTGNIPNSLGTNRFGFILQLSEDLQTILSVAHFPQGAVEDIRFMKTNTLPYQGTGDLYISANTSDTYANDGGYIIAKLDNNFVNGVPTALSWFKIAWAEAGPKDYHPWDVTSDGEVYHVTGQNHAYDWSAMYCLDANGQRKIVPNWRTHWLTSGSEWKGTPASAAPGGLSAVNYSGIAFKIGGRCELRSWTQQDFDAIEPDGNGGTRKGSWPADFLFSGPCDPNAPTANGGGYNGYSPESCCPVWGATCVAVDKRNNWMYLGMNFKSYSNPANSPDFEPAVICFDETGNMVWWSRLYHEITPAGDTVYSLPDQYVDALAIDYANDKLVIGARAHGNNTENLWEGNTIAGNPNAKGFQNQFTGTNGNIHESWIGKLRLADGSLTNSTYMAELFEGTGSLGTQHPDPNLAGWPDPNTGWPNVNTTRITKNNMKVSSTGELIVLGVGRRTITTVNAYQRNISPWSTGVGCWNSFVRMYDESLGVPKYSSLIVGVWDTLTQQGGDNAEMFGVYKTDKGVIAVGRQKATNGVPNGNNLPVANVPAWGTSTPSNETALLVYYQSDSLMNPTDVITGVANGPGLAAHYEGRAFPNPTTGIVEVMLPDDLPEFEFVVTNVLGQTMATGHREWGGSYKQFDLSQQVDGVYFISIRSADKTWKYKVVKGRIE
ncbi:MAG: T9SS type A sorting domain-containing protein [Bacteroidetes bacterium]|nr:T9SS type A sorting domain-containing protein [Bacteroidota bacterium]